MLKHARQPSAQQAPPKKLPAPARKKEVKRFDAAMNFKGSGGGASWTLVKDSDGRVIDVVDVMIKGYLSKFRDSSELDRDGEYILPGSYKEAIAKFSGSKRMPLLTDHRNTVESQAGSFSKLKEDATGLYIEAEVSNAPDMLSTRFKIAEGHLTTLSIGGYFSYLEDGRGIVKVALYEGSLTPVPADPDASFQTRSLNAEEAKRFKSGCISI